MGNSLQENKVREFSDESTIPRQDKLLESVEIFSNEINMRLSEAMDSLMSVMHSQINRAMNSATNDRIIPEIQSIMGSLFTGHRDTEFGTSGNGQGRSEQTSGLKTKITKEDSRSAFDPRNTRNVCPSSKHC